MAPSAVVIEVGARHVSFGIADDPRPLCVLDTASFSRDQQFSVPPNNYSDHENTALCTFSYLFHPNLLDYEPGTGSGSFEHALNVQLFDIFHHLFTTYKIDSVNANIVLVANSMLNNTYKTAVTFQLLEKLHAKSTLFLDDALMTLVAAGLRTGLVVDLGWHFVTISPVFDLRLLQNHAKWSKRAAKYLYFKTDPLSLESIDIDQLFTVDENCYDTDEKTPSQLLIELHRELPIDLRKPLFENIVFTGGLAENQTVVDKIVADLKSAKIHTETAFSLGSWQGASLYTATVLAKDGNWNTLDRIKRENYITP
ncbi:hypothetical protein OGAPHI_006502 [Ogataea philodendri]|uniref:Uncharacterized protein n=1 Tax=Ogataea philodendri TaxID=1378263 RepID=A0A9P8NY11_9ASCO|nr:uncharacterized protein OGAPHI_006502 [Ogataea philodendri]KAH3661652.1 hypothetical protein OGAPHI_006502 [Ogataea philodendri]